MKKRFVQLAYTNVPTSPPAYWPIAKPELTAATAKLALKSAVTRLAHDVLARWGIEASNETTELKTYEVPSGDDILKDIWAELSARQRAGLMREGAVLVCGHDVDDQIWLSPGQAHHQGFQGPMRVFGLRVVISPYLEPGSWIVLPNPDTWRTL